MLRHNLLLTVASVSDRVGRYRMARSLAAKSVRNVRSMPLSWSGHQHVAQSTRAGQPSIGAGKFPGRDSSCGPCFRSIGPCRQNQLLFRESSDASHSTHAAGIVSHVSFGRGIEQPNIVTGIAGKNELPVSRRSDGGWSSRNAGDFEQSGRPRNVKELQGAVDSASDGLQTIGSERQAEIRPVMGSNRPDELPCRAVPYSQRPIQANAEQ